MLGNNDWIYRLYLFRQDSNEDDGSALSSNKANVWLFKYSDCLGVWHTTQSYGIFIFTFITVYCTSRSSVVRQLGCEGISEYLLF